MLDLNKSVVYVAGAVNLEGTLKNVAEAIVAYNESKSNDFDAIATAVNAVFDRYPGAHVQVPALISLVCGKLAPTTLEAMAVCQERTKEYLKANTGEGGFLETRKGKGGGVCRVSDKPVAPPAAV